MFGRLIRSCQRLNITYKRNSFSFTFRSLNTFSTNHNNNKTMENIPLEKKIEELNIVGAGPKVEEKQENKTEEKT